MAYPVVLNLEGRLCAVIGAGKVAERKVVGLLEAGASVKVVGIVPTQHIREWADQKRITYHHRAFHPFDLDGCWLAFAATNEESVNDCVGATAKAKGILFCHSAGGEGDFSLPAILQQEDLLVAISTGGSSPMYARLIRDALNAFLAEGHGEVLSLLRETRAHLKETVSDPNRRQEIWRSILSSDTFEAVQVGNLDHVKQRIAQCL